MDDLPATRATIGFEIAVLEHTGTGFETRSERSIDWSPLVVRTPPDYNWTPFLNDIGPGGPRSMVEVELYHLHGELYMHTLTEEDLTISNLDSRYSYTFSIDQGIGRIPNGTAYWIGDFDDDGTAELGLRDSEIPLKVVEIYGGFRDNPDATNAIAQASRDFAANRQTGNEADFQALWREHGPSASVAALALIAEVDWDSYLSALQDHVSEGVPLFQAAALVAPTVPGQKAEDSALITGATVPATPTPSPIEEINFTGVVTSTNSPSQVQVVFSLRDQNGHAIVLPAEEIQQVTRVFEAGPGTEGMEEIDYAETSFFVHTAENFDLEVVFVLDFTNSMSQARLPDGRSGIDAMIEAFESGLAVLPGAHRIGVVEFHDRNAEPRVLSELTTDRQSIRESVGRFLQTGFDPGSSRVWDSVVEGVNLFSTRAQNPRAIRALVFLSDGRDTSSANFREDALRAALSQGVQLYSMGVGDVFQEGQLRRMANSTGGAYYPARDPSLLQEQLQLIVSDLRGQYQVSYITLRRTGKYVTEIAVELGSARGSMTTPHFDVAAFLGPDNRGSIQFDPPSIDRANRQAVVFVRALHVPRNIDRIRFKLGTAKPVNVDLVARQDGGLLEGWNLSGPDSDGFYEVSSPTPLEFGNFGLLFKLTLAGIVEPSLEVPIGFDNSIYTADKRFLHPSLITLGPPLVTAGRVVSQSDGTGPKDATNTPTPIPLRTYTNRDSSFGYAIGIPPGWRTTVVDDKETSIRSRDGHSELKILIRDFPLDLAEPEFANARRQSVIDTHAYSAAYFDIKPMEEIQKNNHWRYEYAWRLKPNSNSCDLSIVDMILRSRYFPAKPYGYIVSFSSCVELSGFAPEDQWEILNTFEEMPP